MDSPLSFTKEETQKITEEVIKICKEYPNAIYKKSYTGTGPTCKYSQYIVLNGPDTEGCVIGQGIRRACPEKFAEIVDIETNSKIINGSVFWSMDSASTVFGEGLLADIQSHQDQGRTWGEALRLSTLSQM